MNEVMTEGRRLWASAYVAAVREADHTLGPAHVHSHAVAVARQAVAAFEVRFLAGWAGPQEGD